MKQNTIHIPYGFLFILNLYHVLLYSIIAAKSDIMFILITWFINIALFCHVKCWLVTVPALVNLEFLWFCVLVLLSIYFRLLLIDQFQYIIMALSILKYWNLLPLILQWFHCLFPSVLAFELLKAIQHLEYHIHTTWGQ